MQLINPLELFFFVDPVSVYLEINSFQYVYLSADCSRDFRGLKGDDGCCTKWCLGSVDSKFRLCNSCSISSCRKDLRTTVLQQMVAVPLLSVFFWEKNICMNLVGVILFLQ